MRHQIRQSRRSIQRLILLAGLTTSLLVMALGAFAGGVLDPPFFVGGVSGADFTAAQALTISGHLRNVNQRGLGNETVFLSGSASSSTQTDANGLYSFTVQSGGTYDITPGDSRVSTWSPLDSRHYDNLSQNVSNADFEARFPSFTVTGVVKNSGGTTFPGVNVRITGTNITTKDYLTNSGGSYTSDQLNVLGDYTFTPQPFTASGKTYTSFNPTNKSFVSILTCNSVPGATCSGFDYLGIDFTATPAPTVLTSAATSITSTTATLNGSVNPNGIPTNAWFEFGTDATLTTSAATTTQAIGSGTSNQAVTANLSGLVAGTTYYFRTVGMSNGGTVRGAISSFGTTPPTALLVQFSASNYTVGEGDGVASINVVRIGDASNAVSVDFVTGNNVYAPCDTIIGSAARNCDYIVNAGTLNFASGETSKTFRVLIIDDAYIEGNENLDLKLTNPSGVALGSLTTAVLTIIDNDLSPATTTPLDNADFFVRLHYYDFLNREADPGGLDYWSSQLRDCGNDQICLIRKRVDVSAAYFGSPEFQRTGSFVYRAFKGGLGRQPSYVEFSSDRPLVVEGPNLEQTKQSYMLAFVQRPEFVAKYVSATTPELFVDALIANIQLNSNVNLTSQRQALIDKYNTGGSMNQSRALATRDAIDATPFQDAELNPAFVLLQYFGYLGRDIDQGGYDFWLNVLNSTNPRNFRGMVCAFITSAEYQKRFSNQTPHSDHECGAPAF